MSVSDHRLALRAGYQFAEYSIIRVLGQGGFGITYLARDNLLNVDVAIKELLPKDSATRLDDVTVVPKRPSDEESFAWARQRFISEARILASLRHDNIVHVNRFLELNGTVYMVMQFLQGQNLTEWLRAPRKLTEEDLRRILMPLLDGLEVVHRNNVLHRDISPENIIITAQHRPMLLDFGSARITVDGNNKMTGVVRPGYSPIEQYQTDAPQGPYTDIYALAGVMIHAITGQVPPLSMDRIGGADSYQPLARRYRGKYGGNFLRSVDQAFSILPQQRPQTVAEWRTQLFEASGPSVVTKARPKVPPSKEESKRREAQLSGISRVGETPVKSDSKRREGRPTSSTQRGGTKKGSDVQWMMMVAVAGLLVAGASFYYIMNGSPSGTETGKGDANSGTAGFAEAKPSGAFNPNKEYTNFLGMKFVPVPGTKVLLCIHQTRRKDYAAFTHANPGVSAEWEHAAWSKVPIGDGPDNPVVMVNWNEAEAFCKWLSEIDSKQSGMALTYRLPAWETWRAARGDEKHPWGNEDAPPKGAGNFADAAAQRVFGENFAVTPGYDDGFATTAPVGSFKPNRLGLSDLGSNVQEWSADQDISSGEMLVLGSSWKDAAASAVLSKNKPTYHEAADSRRPFIGFRCVLAPP